MDKPKKTDLKMTAAEYRGELVKRGHTVSGWARQNQFRATTVFEAIKGTRHGPLSKKIIRKLNQELGA